MQIKLCRDITFTINASLCSVRNVFLKYYVLFFTLLLADANTAILIKHRALSKLHLLNHLTSECLKEQLLLLNSYYPLHKFSNGKCVFLLHAAYHTTLTH